MKVTAAGAIHYLLTQHGQNQGTDRAHRLRNNRDPGHLRARQPVKNPSGLYCKPGSRAPPPSSQTGSVGPANSPARAAAV